MWFCAFQLYYEVQVVEHLPTNFGENHQETNPHVLRVGWSIDESSFQLGMATNLLVLQIIKHWSM